MQEKQMEELLAQLRREVAAASTLSDSQRARMEALQEEIRQRLETGELAHDDSPARLVRRHIDEFQRSHPTLTMVLSRVLDSLNKMGI